MTQSPLTPAGATAHTPLPWRASKCGYLMGSDNEVRQFGPREVQVGKIGDFFDKELLPFNRDRWQADLEFIVRACNSHQALVDAVRTSRCPVPSRCDPDELTAGQCFDLGHCGCLNGTALALASVKP